MTREELQKLRVKLNAAKACAQEIVHSYANAASTIRALATTIADRLDEAVAALDEAVASRATIARLEADLAKATDKINAHVMDARLWEGRALEAEARALDFAESIVCRNVGSSRPYDHACAECIPGGSIVVAGFRCVGHRAQAVVDAAEIVKREAARDGGSSS